MLALCEGREERRGSYLSPPGTPRVATTADPGGLILLRFREGGRWQEVRMLGRDRWV